VLVEGTKRDVPRGEKGEFSSSKRSNWDSSGSILLAGFARETMAPSLSEGEEAEQLTAGWVAV